MRLRSSREAGHDFTMIVAVCECCVADIVERLQIEEILRAETLLRLLRGHLDYQITMRCSCIVMNVYDN